MSKRMTSTDKYKKPFFRGLKGEYKLFWDYLYHDCNHAGIWIVDFDIAQVYLGNDMIVNKADALKYFNADKIRIIEINNGKEWFILPFIKYQYGELHENNRVHNSVIAILKEKKVFKTLTRPLKGCKDKAKAKDIDKEKDKKSYVMDDPPTEQDIYLYMLGYSNDETIKIKPETVKLLAKAFITHYSKPETNWTYIPKGTSKVVKIQLWKSFAKQWLIRKQEDKR